MIKPKRSLGQNFLVNKAVIDKIISAVAELDPKNIIEVGPGLGALTSHLINMNKNLTLIELDRDLVTKWKDEKQNVIEGDALQIDWQAFSSDENTVLVSNLPYQISSSIVIERSVEPYEIKAMVLMFQKEVAQRLMAKKSTPEYGMLTVVAQVFWKIEKVCDADPKSFNPPPNVASRVLKFVRKEGSAIDRKKFLSFVKMAFAQRRKLLAKNLNLESEKLVELGFKKTVRAEELSPEEFVSLFQAINT
jgi:16S rRNA (adenine1518-N6/adenine1519-N6)-dimethyltransferase